MKELLEQDRRLRRRRAPEGWKGPRVSPWAAKVCYRLPPLPRLKIIGLASKPVYLLPETNERGRVVPNVWVLPAVRDAADRWHRVTASTDTLQRRLASRGCKVRVLN